MQTQTQVAGQVLGSAVFSVFCDLKISCTIKIKVPPNQDTDSNPRPSQNPTPTQPASPPPQPPAPRRRRKPQNPWVLPWILQREERGCYRTLLDELITRNFTSMEPAFFYLIEERITPTSGSQLPTSGRYWKSG